MEADNQSGELCCARILRVKPPWCNEIASKQRGCTVQRVKLDAIDLRILRDLQDDGRMTNVELSQRAGISAPPCLRRVRALEESGYVRGYHADDRRRPDWAIKETFLCPGRARQPGPSRPQRSFEDLMVADWLGSPRMPHDPRRRRLFYCSVVARDKEHRDQADHAYHRSPPCLHRHDAGNHPDIQKQCRACLLIRTQRPKSNSYQRLNFLSLGIIAS